MTKIVFAFRNFADAPETSALFPRLAFEFFDASYEKQPLILLRYKTSHWSFSWNLTVFTVRYKLNLCT